MRIRRSWPSVAVLSALLSVSGCGGGSDDEPDAAASNPDSGSTPDAAASSIDAGPDAAPPLVGIDILCDPSQGLYVDFMDRAFECLPWFVKISFWQILPTLTRDGFSDTCYGQFQDYFTDGTIQIDNGQIAACRTWLMNAECYEVTLEDISGTNPCLDVLSGQVPTDGDCEADFQCAGDAYCAPGEGCGVCTDRLANDAECSSHNMCSSGYCKTGDPNTCATKGDVGDLCTEDSGCIGYLGCDPDAEPSVCADLFPAVPAVGDPCVPDNIFSCGYPVETGLYCHPDLSECETLPAVGEDCIDTDNPILRCNVLKYEWCNPIDGKCTAPQTGAQEGEDCRLILDMSTIPAGQPTQCADGMLCQFQGGPENGICVMPGSVGDSCTQEGDPDCRFMLGCDVDSGECMAGDYSGLCPAP